MRPPRPTPLVILLALVLFAVETQAQVVLVEDFELPDTTNFITYFAPQQIVTSTNSWQVIAESVDLYEAAARAEAAAFDGGQAVDLAGSPGAGVIEATFSTVPGQSYRLVFHYARNALLGVEVGDARVDVTGGSSLLSATVQHDPGIYSFDTYLQFSDTFVADGTQAVLRFTSLESGNAGITIDGISITASPAVPVLSTLAVLALLSALSLVAWGSIRRRVA